MTPSGCARDPSAPIDPSEVVALVQGLVRDPWPASETRRELLFERLGLKELPREETQNPHIVGTEQHFIIDAPVAGPVVCTWVLDGGAFRQLYFQLRCDALPPSPEISRCFDDIEHHFTRLYGEAAISRHGNMALHRIWDANGMELDVHYGNGQRSVLMVCISPGESGRSLDVP